MQSFDTLQSTCRARWHPASGRRHNVSLSRQPHRRLFELDESRQCLGAGQPGADLRIGLEIDVAFGGARYVAVERDIGDRRPVCGNPASAFQLLLDQRQDRMRTGITSSGR